MSGAEGRSAELPFLRGWLLQIMVLTRCSRKQVMVELGSAFHTKLWCRLVEGRCTAPNLDCPPIRALRCFLPLELDTCIHILHFIWVNRHNNANSNNNQHRWSSGRIRRCHRRGPCSIHGRCTFFLLSLFWSLFSHIFLESLLLTYWRLLYMSFYPDM